MKKLLVVMLSLTLVMGMVGCGQKDTGADSSSSSVQESTTESSVEESTQESSVEESTPESSVEENADEVTVMTHDEFVTAELDSPVVVETYVQAKQGWWDNKATVYTQAEDGAYFLYDMPCSEEDYAKLTEGTKIRVSGYKAEWSGEVEIIEATYEILEGNYIPEALDVTEMLASDELINHQNEFVAFKGMTVEPSTDANGNEVAFLYNWDGSGQAGSDSDLYFNVSYNGQTYTFTVEYYLCNETTDVYQAVTNLKVGDVVDMEGFLYWYNGANPHITSLTVK